MKKLLLATHNKHKAQELKALLGTINAEILTLEGFPQVGTIHEDAPTLEGNALKKAREVFQATGLPSLADDSGLEVYYLNNEPGVFSSRYAGPNATYQDNCKKLLGKLRGVPARRRQARFRCVLAFVAHGNVQHTSEGILNGVIIESPRGTNGFGYDPIFLPTGSAQTLAELDSASKNTLSHRSKAIKNMETILREYFP
jgi:XTP/dITP diphosphohydrolase